MRIRGDREERNSGHRMIQTLAIFPELFTGAPADRAVWMLLGELTMLVAYVADQPPGVRKN